MKQGEPQPTPPIIPSPAPVQAPHPAPAINRDEMINKKLSDLQKNIEDNIKNYFNDHLAKIQAPKPPQPNIQAVMEKKIEAPKPIPPPQPPPQRIQPIAAPPQQPIRMPPVPMNPIGVPPQAAKPFYFNTPYKRPIV